MNFKGKRVLIMGLGTLGGGVGTARFFVNQGAIVTVTDLRDAQQLSKSIENLESLPIQFVLGKHREEDFQKTDLVLKNPGIPNNSPFLSIARSHAIPIEMAENLFLKLSPTNNIIGVTGTRGKSTTSHLIYNILKDAGYDAYIAGNVNDTSTLSLLDKINEKSFIVLELSSWMLNSLTNQSPHISVITNIYPDHLNRYGSMEEYIQDKLNIIRFQTNKDFAVLNREDAVVRNFNKKTKGHAIWFSKQDWPKEKLLRIPGEHNMQNAAAALTVSRIIGIDDNKSQHSISTFSGLPHRLENIRMINGITFINDSASTTPIAGIVALKSFPNKNIILITGGNSKNIPLSEFVDTAEKRAKKIIYFDGTASSSFSHISNGIGPIPLSDMEEAVHQAYIEAESGDIVLFSPATTHLPSYNEFIRGARFKDAVNSLQTK